MVVSSYFFLELFQLSLSVSRSSSQMPSDFYPCIKFMTDDATPMPTAWA
jgi:hypothetical protein